MENHKKNKNVQGEVLDSESEICVLLLLYNRQMIYLREKIFKKNKKIIKRLIIIVDKYIFCSLKMFSFIFLCKRSCLTLNLPIFLNGIIHLPFWELSIIILGISRLELEVGQPTVQSLVRLYGCEDCPDSILVAKTNHFRFQQDKG